MLSFVGTANEYNLRDEAGTAATANADAALGRSGSSTPWGTLADERPHAGCEASFPGTLSTTETTLQNGQFQLSIWETQ